jgi:hypothetical protein
MHPSHHALACAQELKKELTVQDYELVHTATWNLLGTVKCELSCEWWVGVSFDRCVLFLSVQCRGTAAARLSRAS